MFFRRDYQNIKTLLTITLNQKLVINETIDRLQTYSVLRQIELGSVSRQERWLQRLVSHVGRRRQQRRQTRRITFVIVVEHQQNNDRHHSIFCLLPVVKALASALRSVAMSCHETFFNAIEQFWLVDDVHVNFVTICKRSQLR
jgi:tetraacyldisaccharide-1-P 4'-kinase